MTLDKSQTKTLDNLEDKWYEVTGIILDGKLYRLRIRRLTPRECFRLQGFPDWAFEGSVK